MCARIESADGREILALFGPVHVLAVAVIGCLALVVLTEAPFWQWVGLAGALLAALAAAVALYRSRLRR